MLILVRVATVASTQRRRRGWPTDRAGDDLAGGNTIGKNGRLCICQRRSQRLPQSACCRQAAVCSSCQLGLVGRRWKQSRLAEIWAKCRCVTQRAIRSLDHCSRKTRSPITRRNKLIVPCSDNNFTQLSFTVYRRQNSVTETQLCPVFTKRRYCYSARWSDTIDVLCYRSLSVNSCSVSEWLKIKRLMAFFLAERSAYASSPI